MGWVGRQSVTAGVALVSMCSSRPPRPPPSQSHLGGDLLAQVRVAMRHYGKMQGMLWGGACAAAAAAYVVAGAIKAASGEAEGERAV